MLLMQEPQQNDVLFVVQDIVLHGRWRMETTG